MNEPSKLRRSLFELLFIRYGAGSSVFKPVIAWRFWNRVSWTLIALGIIGWILGLWFLRGYAELP